MAGLDPATQCRRINVQNSHTKQRRNEATPFFVAACEATNPQWKDLYEQLTSMPPLPDWAR
jgi:hypothetical protein